MPKDSINNPEELEATAVALTAFVTPDVEVEVDR